jgi:beta-galactosidase/beta-glucuronidase
VKGAFARGKFDVSKFVNAGQMATLAVLIKPPPHPGTPLEQTVLNGTGRNGGILAEDGPTFLCTIGWDWIPGIRDRDMGIWQKVFLSATGPVVIENPLVSSDLPLPKTDVANLQIEATVRNTSGAEQKGVLHGTIDNIDFKIPLTLKPNESHLVKLTPATTPKLHVHNPRLWWPNGYGPQNLYRLHLSFDVNGNAPSDSRDVNFGIRKITYSVPNSDNLTVSVNGVPIMCRGGNWGMDEALKRIPRERIEACVRLHQLANFTMIRNWVGQSTSEDLYDMCDKYGILLWDEFFQPNPSDGPNPLDTDLFLTNVREKVLRFRNHPSIAIWCGRNEGKPPPAIDAGIQKIMTEL